MKPKDPEKARARKKRKALSRVRKAMEKAKELTPAKEFSEWENEFAESLEEKLQTYDRAFSDPDKGRLDEALSYRQAIKLKEIEDKAKGKAKKPFRSKKPMSRGNGFQKKNITTKEQDAAEVETVEQVEQTPTRPKGPLKLSIIKGGKEN